MIRSVQPALLNVSKCTHMLIAVKTSAHRTEIRSVCGPSRAKYQQTWYVTIVFHLLFEGRQFFQPVLLSGTGFILAGICNPCLQGI